MSKLCGLRLLVLSISYSFALFVYNLNDLSASSPKDDILSSRLSKLCLSLLTDPDIIVFSQILDGREYIVKMKRYPSANPLDVPIALIVTDNEFGPKRTSLLEPYEPDIPNAETLFRELNKMSQNDDQRIYEIFPFHVKHSVYRLPSERESYAELKKKMPKLDFSSFENHNWFDSVEPRHQKGNLNRPDQIIKKK